MKIFSTDAKDSSRCGSGERNSYGHPDNLRYTLGLDIGIASIGWAVLDNRRQKILRIGVRAFEKAENPKDGSSLAAVRRTARGARRRIARRRGRMQQIRELMVRYGILPNLEIIDELFAQHFEKTPYDLRAEGLDRELSHTEWVRVLLHIAKHRGFKSNRKNELTADDDKKDEGKRLLSGITDNLRIMQCGGYRTAGEMLAKDEKFAANKRNKSGDYSHTLKREMLEDEVNQLFAAQRSFSEGKDYFGEEFQREYMSIFLHQLPFASGDQILRLVGYCTFERSEKRAPRSSWTAERFMLMNKVINLRIRTKSSERKLSRDERNAVIGLAYKNASVKFDQIRKVIEMNESDTFIGFRYKRNQDNTLAEKQTFVELKGTHAISKKLGEKAITFSESAPQYFDEIAFAVTTYKTDDDIRSYLHSHTTLTEEQTESMLDLSFARYSRLSLKAMRAITPHMESGLLYNEACERAGYNHSVISKDGGRSKLLPLPDTEDIPNPVVKRALHQLRKLVNAIIREYGSPEYVHIEMARDVAKPFDERRAIEKEQNENRAERERLAKDIAETFKIDNPRGGDILKRRLAKEQKDECAYSGTPFDMNRLIADGKYAEIDHILPYSRSMDDSYTNKVLVLATENQNKRNRTPYEYFGSDEIRWHRFTEWVNSNITNAKKKQNLLRTSFTMEEASEMTERNLNDTRYIVRFVRSWIEDTLLFANPEIKLPVVPLNGRVTAMLRGIWGLANLKDREANDLHHALDAAVIAAASRSMIKRISDHSSNKELHLLYDITEERQKKYFPLPWPGFRNELKTLLSPNPIESAAEEKLTERTEGRYTQEDIEALKPIFVSRMPNRKATGAAHAETIRGIRDGVTVTRTPLTSLTPANLEKMWGKERDKRLYEALRSRLAAHGNDAAKAFKEPFYKPSDTGAAPIVRSIKISSVDRSGIEIREGRAANGGMVRVDVYTKGKRFYLVPHYVDDVAKKIIKNRAIVGGSASEDEWDVIDDTYEFIFSLFYNDLVKVQRGDKTLFGYYKGTHRANSTITLEAHDGSQVWEGTGVKTAKLFEKYQVDMLGNYTRVERERAPQGKRAWAGESSA